MSTLSKKEKRAFQRLVTGLSIGNHQNAYMRFMTLTSAKDSPRDINKSFNLLKMRIQRAFLQRDGFHGFKFNRYFKLKTAEGHNVLHIIYWGRYIPHEWLKRTWDQIHGAFKVDIRACWSNNGRKYRRMQGIVGYLLTNYLYKQPILRMSYGWKWAWLGFCRSWKHVKSMGVGWIRRTGQLSDKPMWVNQKADYEPDQRVIPIPTGRMKWRNVTLELWNFLTKDPLPTSRQIKFCNPSFTQYRRGWF